MSYKLEVTSEAPWSGMRGFQQFAEETVSGSLGPPSGKMLGVPRDMDPRKSGEPRQPPTRFQRLWGASDGCRQDQHSISPSYLSCSEDQLHSHTCC